MSASDKQVWMACPHCGAELSGKAELFSGLCQCPACGQSGYFVKVAEAAAPALPAPLPARPRLPVPPEDAPAGRWVRPLAWGLGGACLCVLLAAAGSLLRPGEAADGLTPPLRAELAAAAAEPDPGKRLRRLQELAAATSGDREVCQMLAAAAIADGQEKERRRAAAGQAAAEAARNARAEAERAELAAARLQEEARRREEDLQARERQLEQLAAREAALAAAEKRLREREDALRREQDDLRRRLAALEKDAAERAAAAKEAEKASASIWDRVKAENAAAVREAVAAATARQERAAAPVIVLPPSSAGGSTADYGASYSYSYNYDYGGYGLWPFAIRWGGPYRRHHHGFGPVPGPKPGPCPGPGPRPKPGPRPGPHPGPHPGPKPPPHHPVPRGLRG